MLFVDRFFASGFSSTDFFLLAQGGKDAAKTSTNQNSHCKSAPSDTCNGQLTLEVNEKEDYDKGTFQNVEDVRINEIVGGIGEESDVPLIITETINADSNSNFVTILTEKGNLKSELYKEAVADSAGISAIPVETAPSAGMEDIPQSFTVSHNAVLDFLMNGDKSVESGYVDMSKFNDLIRFPKEVKKKKKKFRFVKADVNVKNEEDEGRHSNAKRNLLMKKLINRYGNISPSVLIRKLAMPVESENNVAKAQDFVRATRPDLIENRSAVFDRKPSLRNIPRKNYLQLHSGPLDSSPNRSTDPSSPEYCETPQEKKKLRKPNKFATSTRCLQDELRHSGVANILKCAQCFGLFLEGEVFDNHKVYCDQRLGKWKFCTYCAFKTLEEENLFKHMNQHNFEVL